MTQAMRVTAYNQEKGESTAFFSPLSIRVREMATEKDELLGGRPQKMMHAKKMGAHTQSSSYALKVSYPCFSVLRFRFGIPLCHDIMQA